MFFFSGNTVSYRIVDSIFLSSFSFIQIQIPKSKFKFLNPDTPRLIIVLWHVLRERNTNFLSRYVSFLFTPLPYEVYIFYHMKRTFAHRTLSLLRPVPSNQSLHKVDR